MASGYDTCSITCSEYYFIFMNLLRQFPSPYLYHLLYPNYIIPTPNLFPTCFDRYFHPYLFRKYFLFYIPSPNSILTCSEYYFTSLHLFRHIPTPYLFRMLLLVLSYSYILTPLCVLPPLKFLGLPCVLGEHSGCPPVGQEHV